MKKYIALFALMILVPTVVHAQNQQGKQEQDSASVETTVISVSNSNGNQVQTQGQVQTQNAGEEQNLQVSSQVHVYLNSAEQKAQGLSEMKGYGKTTDEIREIGKGQVDAQDTIRQGVEKLNSRSKGLKLLIGCDRQALGELKSELAQNQLRVQALEEIKTQVYNQADSTQIQETVEALVEQNTALQEMIENEESTFSLFGWLVKLLNA